MEHTDQLKGALKTKVETNREMITFSKFLATIKIDVPIQLDMDSLVRERSRRKFAPTDFRGTGIPDTDRSRSEKENAGNGITTQPETKRQQKSNLAPSTFSRRRRRMQGDLFANFTPDEPGEAKKKSNLETLESLTYSYQLIDTEEKRQEIIQKLLTSKILSLDTETTGTEPMDAELVGMSFRLQRMKLFMFPTIGPRRSVKNRK